MRAKFSWMILGIVLVSLVTGGEVSAQTVTGQLSGHVMDTSKAVMPGVKVTLKSEENGATREATTNDEGFFLFSFVPLGKYSVTATNAGFQVVHKAGVVIELNRTTVSDFELKPSAVSSQVEVTGEAPLIETTAGELKHSLDTKTIESIPLAGRNFISLVEDIPGFQNVSWVDGAANNPTNSTGSYAAFNGTGSRSTTFQIDGVNNDDSSENQNRQGVNISSIKEVQVLTNAYSAEFGRAGGAVLLIQTKSGTNKFHGDAYDFIQNDLLNANGFFQNRQGVAKQIIRRDQYGWTVGGPIFKDKLFFFNSGERVFSHTFGTMTRMIWLPSDGPRICNVGETPRPGRAGEPLGNYCIDPVTHPNAARDLDFVKSVMSLWNTPEL
ncbi:MAG: carboxypeptidase regulatory-like domain-containing protein [Acidobacteria bacterium]|nr:carboxypeptidase regulatory-like domain-containing protein [Acidobacteriota bacterium]